jgi:hypothetical protein
VASRPLRFQGIDLAITIGTIVEAAPATPLSGNAKSYRALRRSQLSRWRSAGVDSRRGCDPGRARRDEAASLADVDPRQLLRVGDDIDFGDPARRDRERPDREQPALRSHVEARLAVDEGWPGERG